MKKQTTPLPQNDIRAIPRSRALIAVPVAAPRPSLLATIARAVVGLLLLPVRLPILAVVGAARGAMWLGKGLCGAVATAGKGLGRGTVLLGTGLGKLIAAPFIIVARLLRLLALGLLLVLRAPVAGLRLLGRGGVLLARGVAWLGVRAGRGIAVLVLLPVKLVALLARLVLRTIVFAVRLPVAALRLLARGGVAVAVPVLALAWGGVRAVAAGIAAVARGIALTLALAGRLLLRGAKALGLGLVATLRSLAIGIFVCVRGLLRAALWIAILPFRALRVIAVVLGRGARSGATMLAHAVAVVAAGIAEIVRGGIAVAAALGRAVGRAARPVGRALATSRPQQAALLPLAALAVLAGAELFAPAGFPFATTAMLLVAAFSYLAILAAPASMLAVLLAWGLAVAAGWRAESVSAETSVWLDALVYVVALAALRSAYVAARTFVREAPALPRAADQEIAHRRASRAIGIVLAIQCAVFAIWSGAEGRLHDAPLFGELLLVGAGLALAWVVRTGHHVRTAQFVLSIGALASLVLVIAAQLHAFADGRLFTAASLGAGVVLLLVAAALTVVVHARLIDAEHGA